MSFKNSLTPLLLTLTLAACGGGGGVSDGCKLTLGGVACHDTSAPNYPPLAQAGPNQQVLVNSLVTLDATASSDPNANPLSYEWKIVEKPSGSNVNLSSTGSVKPTFRPDREGDYKLELTVSDGSALSKATMTVTAAIQNVRPTAHIQIKPTALVNDTVIANGQASSDANNDRLTYQWRLFKPDGSNAALDSATSVAPSFVVDKSGIYVLSLSVVDEKRLESELITASVKVSDQNVAPSAVATSSQGIMPGKVAFLDGSGSTDPNRDNLTYKWEKLYSPNNTTVNLSPNDQSARVTFTPTVEGDYVFSLTVSDGRLSSVANTSLNVSRNNIKPVAVILPVASTVVNRLTTLDGKASFDANGDALNYKWVLISVPGGAAAPTLQGTLTPQLKFTPNLSGDYAFGLTVDDGTLQSEMVFVTVNVQPQVAAPLAVTQPLIQATLNKTVYVDGSLSTVDPSRSLSYLWTPVASPTNGVSALSPLNRPTLSFVPTVAGSYVFTLTVFDGLTTSPPVVAVVNVSSGNAPPMANAGQNFSVTLGTSVTLNGVASDPNNDPMTYQWVVNAMPTGGSATIANLLSNPNTLTPSFTAQALGTYVFGLIASDSTSSSQVSTVSVTTNSPTPTARIAMQSASALPYVLDGSSSFSAIGKELNFQWSVVYQPVPNAAVLLSPTSVKPIFNTTAAGLYVVQLIVSNKDNPEIQSMPVTFSFVVP